MAAVESMESNLNSAQGKAVVGLMDLHCLNPSAHASSPSYSAGLGHLSPGSPSPSPFTTYTTSPNPSWTYPILLRPNPHNLCWHKHPPDGPRCGTMKKRSPST
ncbi:hypothetical protein L211DRAFT_871391, partial [Terfezia boudieri ATCC MYA-4762]